MWRPVKFAWRRLELAWRRVDLKRAVNRRAMWINIGAIVAVLAGLIAWDYQRTREPEKFAKPAGVLDGGGIAVAGDGPVTVEVYLDFFCPACTMFHSSATHTLDEMVADRKIRLVWHTLGLLDKESSPAGYSTRAASSAGCASDAGRLKAYGEALLDHRPPQGGPGLSDDQLIEIGGNAGIITPSFAQCVRAVKYRDWVGHVNDLGARSGVHQAPTVFVAGKRIDDPSVANLQAAVDSAS